MFSLKKKVHEILQRRDNYPFLYKLTETLNHEAKNISTPQECLTSKVYFKIRNFNFIEIDR